MAAELQPNTFEADGINIWLTYDDAVDAVENQENIDASLFVLDEDQFPLVATGFFDSNGDWRFYATHSERTDYKLEYDEFIEAVNETE